MTSVATGTSRGLNVRTSAVQSRCNRNRQPRASNAHPYTAVCTRRRRLTTQFESQTRCAPCQSSCTSPRTPFGNNHRVSNNNWQRLCPPMPVDQSTTQRRAARTITVYIHRPTAPLLYEQPVLAGATACATRARTVSRNCRNTYTERAVQHVQQLRHPGCTHASQLRA